MVGAIVVALFYAPVSVAPAAAPTISSDQDILNKVKQAGLWEMPVGSELAARGQVARARDIGQRISNEHHELDEKTHIAAATVGTTLPTEPTAEQKQWITDVSQASSSDVDRIAVNRMRAAHGKVLPLLAQVKVGTRDPVIRAFVTESMIYVSRHISYLESTGLVDFSALPEPTVAAVPPTSTPYVAYLGWAVLGVALLWWTYHRVFQKNHSIPQHRRR